ncbi:MAG: penicillin-binding protein 2 [Clostridia bacterium]|nr:penicillin-binding protein 2 [Clostridia bacterium]
MNNLRTKKKKINKNNINLRYNLATVLTYFVGIILIGQLFNLQIVHGEEYREQSNTRLTRETSLEAARGKILDRTGSVLVTSETTFALELYKSKVDTQVLNDCMLEIVNTFNKYGIKVPDTFPIEVNPYRYTIEGENLQKWQIANGITVGKTAEQVFNEYKENYVISNNSLEDARKIIGLRYEISKKGYSSTRAFRLADNVSREAIAEISEKSSKFPGVNVVVEPKRQYTSGNVASHILGYSGKINQEEYEKNKDRYDINDIIGRTGIEYAFEGYLKGINGVKQIDMGVDGTASGEYVTKDAVAGSNVVLTIDANLQRIVESTLAGNIQKIASGGFGKVYDAQAGSAVVMNVKTGEVLAMASYPDYDPSKFVGGISTQDWNNYNNNPNHPLVNKAMQVSYAPGSTFKMISAIAALESGVVSPTERINDTGVYKLGNRTWNCWYYTDYHTGHGPQDVTGAIKNSCNYYFYEVGNRMGIDALVKYAKYFGLGNKTGIELRDEAKGVLASKEAKGARKQTWVPGDMLNAVIGQGLNEFTPIQMAKYISTLANGGNKVDVSIVKTIINADGTEVPREEINKYVNERLGLEDEKDDGIQLNKDYLRLVLDGMQSVTQEAGGTAYNIFRDFPIKVGGKTGSAEAPGNKVNAWFVGFAPFDDPEIAIVVMVENGGHGNYTAEVVRDIMSEYFGMNTKDVQEDISAKAYTQFEL